MKAAFTNSCRSSRGFTLIEIIVAIIVSAILAVIVVQIVGGNTLRSLWPLQSLDRSLALQDVMENVTSDYKNLLATDSTPLVTLIARIQSGQYWTGQPFSGRIQIQATITCDDNITAIQEVNPHTCDNTGNTETIMKLTISVQGTQQSLTALFTR